MQKSDEGLCTTVHVADSASNISESVNEDSLSFGGDPASAPGRIRDAVEQPAQALGIGLPDTVEIGVVIRNAPMIGGRKAAAFITQQMNWRRDGKIASDRGVHR